MREGAGKAEDIFFLRNLPAEIEVTHTPASSVIPATGGRELSKAILHPPKISKTFNDRRHCVSKQPCVFGR